MTASPAAGAWIVLFDGGSTDALRGYGRDTFPGEAWEVEYGALRTIPGAGVDLITRDTFGDFELEFEWRVSVGGNSGVMYGVVESDQPAWTSGPEYQILDDEAHPDGANPLTSAGALYDLIAPGRAKRLEPVGGYNTGRIVLRAGRVEHWLNGAIVLAYDWDGSDLRERIARSKFGDLAQFMVQPDGHIVFQHHGEEVWLRNMRIRPAQPG